MTKLRLEPLKKCRIIRVVGVVIESRPSVTKILTRRLSLSDRSCKKEGSRAQKGLNYVDEERYH